MIEKVWARELNDDVLFGTVLWHHIQNARGTAFRPRPQHRHSDGSDGQAFLIRNASNIGEFSEPW